MSVPSLLSKLPNTPGTEFPVWISISWTCSECISISQIGYTFIMWYCVNTNSIHFLHTDKLVFCWYIDLLCQMRTSGSIVRGRRRSLSPPFRLMRLTAVSIAPKRGLVSPWMMTQKVSICFLTIQIMISFLNMYVDLTAILILSLKYDTIYFSTVTNTLYT